MEIGNLFTADGRVGRKDWIVWIVAVWIVFAIIAWILGDRGSLIQIVLAIVAGIAGIFMGIKRLHDLGKSGWYYLLGLVPLVNFFFAIYLIVWKGDTGDNRFGAPNSGSPFPSLH